MSHFRYELGGGCCNLVSTEFLENAWNFKISSVQPEGPGNLLENSIYPTYSRKTSGTLRKRARPKVKKLKLTKDELKKRLIKMSRDLNIFSIQSNLSLRTPL